MYRYGSLIWKQDATEASVHVNVGEGGGTFEESPVSSAGTSDIVASRAVIMNNRSIPTCMIICNSLLSTVGLGPSMQKISSHLS